MNTFCVHFPERYVKSLQEQREIIKMLANKKASDFDRDRGKLAGFSTIRTVRHSIDDN